MLGPIELQLFPSCRDCLSWSEDGELAVAAGEYVHIITPKHMPNGAESGSVPQTATGNWDFTRIRANVFNNKEWPTIYPQKRDDFSIGPEQSFSTVVGLAWSPPGLGKHRKSVLAVLTSNLYLSFYEAVGPQGKWARVAVVNEALRSHFQTFIDDKSQCLRKVNIRSFTWCPALKPPISEGANSSLTLPSVEARWGIQLLTIVNDDNDVIFIQTRRPKPGPSSTNNYVFDILSTTELRDRNEEHPLVQPGSIFATALKTHIRTLHVSCGPWIYESANGNENVHHVTGTVGAIYGTEMRMVKLNLTLTPVHSDSGIYFTYKSEATSDEHPFISLEKLAKHQLTGPVQWVYKDEYRHVYVAAGVIAGCVVLSVPLGAYTGKDRSDTMIGMQEHSFYGYLTSEMDSSDAQHWEPISAMTVAYGENSQSSVVQLHLGTTGGYTAAKAFSDTQENSSLFNPAWKKQLDSFKDQFDIDRDLGGFVIGRICGLASNRGVTAAAMTMHPGDMVEYCTASEERTVIVFSSLNLEHEEKEISSFGKKMSNCSPDFLRSKREVVVRYILHAAYQSGDPDLWCPSVVYAAACCVIVEIQDEELLALAQKVLESLTTTTGADLGDEISKCSTEPKTIDAKSVEQLNGPGGQIFERCDICDEGISWYSAQEAQCTSGHLFVRCSLSMLSIQEPGVSKFCSSCGTEYLSEDLISTAQETSFHRTYQILSDIFDTCIYCGGKFGA